MRSPVLRLAAVLLVAKHFSCWAYEPVKNLPACVKSAPGPQFTCGGRGYLYGQGETAFSYKNVTTLAACHVECLQHVDPQAFFLEIPDCYSIGYDAQAQACSGYKDLASAGNFSRNARSTTVYYDTQCFACLYASPPPAGSNLFANGGFETPTSARSRYSPWYTTFGRVAPGGYRSPNSLRVGDHFTLSQKYYLPTPGYYDLTFDYKFSAVKDSEKFILSAGWDRVLFQPTGVNNDSWASFRGTFDLSLSAHAPSDPWYTRLSSVAVDIFSSPPRYSPPQNIYRLDNVKLTPSPQGSFQARPDATNVLQNGGFEAGSLEGYTTINHNGQQTTPGPAVRVVPGGATAGSQYALEVDLSRAPRPGRVAFSLSQDVHLQNDTDYLLGFSFHIGNDTGDCRTDYGLALYLDDTANGYLTPTNSTPFGDGETIGKSFVFGIGALAHALPESRTQYVLYQLPTDTWSSYTQRAETSRFTVDISASRPKPPDPRGQCVLLLDDFFLKARA